MLWFGRFCIAPDLLFVALIQNTEFICFITNSLQIQDKKYTAVKISSFLYMKTTSIKLLASTWHSIRPHILHKCFSL